MLQTDARTDAQMDNMKTVYPQQTKFAGDINTNVADQSVQSYILMIAYSKTSFITV